MCESVWAGKLVQGTKLRAFFVPLLPLVNLSQTLQGSSGREREREREREGGRGEGERERVRERKGVREGGGEMKQTGYYRTRTP